MILKKLAYVNMRNLKNNTIEPADNINVFTGENAQGKTNILECIHICCTGRSHRTHKDDIVINNDSQRAYIDAYCEKKDGMHRIEIALNKNNKKSVSINSYPAKRLGELMGHMNCVMFSPEDISLITLGPQYRRKYIDIALSQIKPTYFYALQNYQKTLLQRNNLLKSIQNKPSNKDSLFIWDEQLAGFGSVLYTNRLEFVDKLNTICKEIHSHISGNRENIEINYQTFLTASNQNDAKKEMIEILERNHDNDIRRQTTSLGLHRDDLKLILNGIDVRTQGSQGQKRTTALSLKLSEIEIMKEYSGETPILLLDDVFSELDNMRKTYLLKYIENIQSFITCVDTESVLLDNIKNISITKIKDGKLIKN